jgi:hypothetical protein
VLLEERSKEMVEIMEVAKSLTGLILLLSLIVVILIGVKKK